MGTSTSVPQFVGKIYKAAEAIEKNRKEQLSTVGKNMTEIHAGIIASTLGHGDQFHHWNVPIVARAKVVSASDLVFAPVGRSKGPERVAEQGRHAGLSGPMQGPISTKKGKASRNQKHRRWNGSTKGKDTWTKTTTELERTLPPKLQSSFIHALEEVFR